MKHHAGRVSCSSRVTVRDAYDTFEVNKSYTYTRMGAEIERRMLMSLIRRLQCREKQLQVTHAHTRVKCGADENNGNNFFLFGLPIESMGAACPFWHSYCYAQEKKESGRKTESNIRSNFLPVLMPTYYTYNLTPSQSICLNYII